MAFWSSLLACLGCSEGPPAGGATTTAGTTAGASAGAPASSAAAPSAVAQTAAQTAAKNREQREQSSVHSRRPSISRAPSTASHSIPPSPTRQSSRVKLDLPLEYVQSPEDEDPEDSIILGRKASYSVGETQPSTRAASRANSNTNLMSLVSDEDDDSEDEVRLLGPAAPSLRDRKCLVLDLDETLVHSSFKYVPDADFIIPVEIENRLHNVYVSKRPGVDEFLAHVGKLFEVVVFTASVAKYGDPLLDHLDTQKVVHHRLFRESCYNFNGNYIKNLSQLGRPLKDVIIIDNSPASYALQPQNAVPVSSWFSDFHDNELLAMLPFLTDLAARDVADVSAILDVFINA